MAYEKFNILNSTAVPLDIDNVYTDQIIPARFLKATERKDFGDINLPGYGLSNLSTSWAVNKKLKFSLKLENVFDKDYFTAATSNAFYLNQGRSVWMRLNYEFEN